MTAPSGGSAAAEQPADPPLDIFDRSLSSTEDLRGQFLLTRDRARLPLGWEVRESAGWLLATCALPVVEVLDQTGSALGWCLGHPIVDGVLAPPTIRLATTESRRLDWPAIDDLYLRTAGRFVLVLLPADEPSVLLDSNGSLAAAYSVDARTVASTPTLIGGEWDTELEELVGFPDRNTWLPFGLTLTRGVRRMQADHRLDLSRWTAERHWPRPGDLDQDLQADEDRVRAVGDGLRSAVQAVAAVHPVLMSLTAGRDSRLLLAMAREVLDRTAFFTMAPPGTETVDLHVARRLAARFGLDHAVVSNRTAGDEELVRWQFRTGHAVGGALWKGHESLRALDPERVLLPGTAGEVGRGAMNRTWDLRRGLDLDAELLVDRLLIQRNPVYLAEAERWLANVPAGLSASRVMDLAYIEHRLSCWAGPGHYGNTTSRFELPVFAGRRLFIDMLALPVEYRVHNGLVRDLCEESWPELLELPFNQWTGLRGVRKAAVRRAKLGVRSGLRRLGVPGYDVIP